MTNVTRAIALAAVASITSGTVNVKADTGTREVLDLSGPGWKLWLDKEAKWEDDVLYLPPVKLSDVPVNPPTGGWDALEKQGVDVSVPGTVEEYLWDAEGGDYRGVSWWWRTVQVPQGAEGKRLVLRVDSVRLRAEVFVDDELVGYDVIGNTPFEVDLTGRLKPGSSARLAFRITDPGGNFDWIDYNAHRWGKYTIPASHGFGGMTGLLRLLIADPVYIDDIFVRNKPDPREVDVEVTIRNTTSEPVNRDVLCEVTDPGAPGLTLVKEQSSGHTCTPGTSKTTLTVTYPPAKLWSPDSPSLYHCTIRLGDGDADTQRFGFRWFAPQDIGKDAVFRLNGKRVVLRSAISWGFWPINGIYPTRDLAHRQMSAAKELGLNMLNNHRCIGRPELFDAADSVGLLQYEEPGGYTARGGDEFCKAWARQKLLRMVKRDRSRPSLVIYNMINEEDQTPPQDYHKRDMRDAHALDPTRVITYTSGWNRKGKDPYKLHMRPYDDKMYVQGWYDYHHAPGPGVYRDEFYNAPDAFRLHDKNRQEILFWGEEGAIATPPRLAKIVEQLAGRRNGWDGAAYKEWYHAYHDYLIDKNLMRYFGSVDQLTQSLGNLQYYYQGRIIENIRAGDVTDGYVINGWEGEKQENHSGIVDCFRNFKGDPAILAHYNAPLYIAVKLRTKVAHAPADVVADLFIVNETDLRGDYYLRASLVDAAGRAVWREQQPVTVEGGERYGQLLAKGVDIQADCGPGRYTLKAGLHRKDAISLGRPLAQGHDELFLVDWKQQALPANGAIAEAAGGPFRPFLAEHKQLDLPTFMKDLDPLHYVLVGQIDLEPAVVVPAARLTPASGEGQGLTGEYFKGEDFHREVLTRTDPVVDFDFSEKPPADAVGSTRYSVRWRGRLTAPESGTYRFHVRCDDGVRLWIDGKELFDDWTEHGPITLTADPVRLQQGKDYDLRLEYFQRKGGAEVRLLWTTPRMAEAASAIVADLPRRVAEDGTTVIVLENADAWARLLAEQGIVKFTGRMNHGRWWLGGAFFVREHPLFADLPVNQAMNWEYQELVHYQVERFGLMLEGEEAVVGSVSDHQHRVSTSVAVVPYGKGRFVLSTLDLAASVNGPPGPADVTRKLLCNYIAFAATDKTDGDSSE